jgi:hypothetical protein
MLMFRGFRSGERIVGSDELDGFRQKQGVHTNLPWFVPPEGKDLHPACLILYCFYMWSCYNDAQMQSGGGGRRYGVASLCVGSIRDMVSMRDCIIAYAS